MNYKDFPALKAYIDRIGAEELNFRRFMVRVYKGNYYYEKAIIKIDDNNDIVCSSKEFEPTDDELSSIKHELKDINFPRAMKADNIDTLKLTNSKNQIYKFIDRKDNKIIMVQELCIFKDGSKAYLPWTFWDDAKWRRMEPDGLLPFWKPEESTSARIMIHEGAKAALAANNLNENHPWYNEMQQYEHWGMIGGALAPHRSDYKEIINEQPLEVVYVADNDFDGKSALKKVSKTYGRALKGIMFDERWPLSWDLADPMPENLFTKKGRYIGPSLKGLMCAATWATENLPSGNRGRPITVLKRDFMEEWRHSVKPEVFIHVDWPNQIFNAQEFNSLVAPFSDVDNTSRLIKKDAASKSSEIKYSPLLPPGIYGSESDGRYINTYCPSTIEPESGNIKPWEDFLNHLVPIDSDRHELKKWCATLIAKPEIRMLYGMLLISETQGIGKGTLGERILAPLVGSQNVSYPSESEIVDSNFNYWLAHKRLAVVHEIYAGHSSKAYNRLKSVITDKNITVSKKYMANYEVENWLHIFACSNSSRAIKLSADDRRWFVPKVTEAKRPSSYWESLFSWLIDEGGLCIIMKWAQEWGDYVLPGNPAPWSSMKQEIIEEGYSPGQILVKRELNKIEKMVEDGEIDLKDAFLLDNDLVLFIKNELYDGKHNDRLERPLTVRKVAKDCGWFVGETRAQIKDWGPSTMGSRVIALDKSVARMRPSELCNDAMSLENKRFPYKLDGPM